MSKFVRKILRAAKPRTMSRVTRACTHKSRLFGNRWLLRTICADLRWKLRRSSSAVATSREGHHPPRSGRAVQHLRWGPAQR
jgi:hypothetical protein